MICDVIIENEQWVHSLPDARKLAKRCYDAVAKSEQGCSGDISFLLTTDEAIRKLNSTFREKDTPTNVLSFSGVREDGHLGDIALGFETCTKEAGEFNIALVHHTAHLMVHGLLHLVGYDHIEEDDAEQMEALEVRILATLGIDDPYKHMEKL